MSSFGYSVLGFGTVATAAATVSAPSSAVIKGTDGTADNVTFEVDDGSGFAANDGNSPDDIGSSGLEFEVLVSGAGVSTRISATKTVTGTIATHAWTAVITALAPVTFAGGATTHTSSTSGTYSTPAIDVGNLGRGEPAIDDTGFITVSYTATNAGGSSAATDVVAHFIVAG